MSQGRYVSGELVRSVYVVNMSSGGGSGTPGGSNTQIQFNNAGVFGGVANSSVNNATGNITLGNRVSVPLGTAALPSIYPGTDTNTGIYSPGADQLAVATNGTGRLFINATGNVGIGTTSPTTPLEIASSGTANALISAFDATASRAYFQVGGTTSGRYTQIGTDTSTTFINDYFGTGIAFQLSASEKARIDKLGQALSWYVYEHCSGWCQRIQHSACWFCCFSISVKMGDRHNGPNFILGKSRSATPGSYTIVQDDDGLGTITFAGDDGTDLQSVAARIQGFVDGIPGADDMPGRLVFSTTSEERMRITSDAYVRLAAGTGGIQFNGDTAAANALDDYEDGTWTPIFVPQTGSFNSITYDSTRAGNYTKVGNLVTVWGIIRTDSVDATGASGLLAIGGLPFSVGTGTTGGGFAVNLLNWAGEYPSSVRPSVGETFAYLGYRTAIDGNDTISNVSDLTTGTGDANRLAFQFSYRV
jgi:hypothetical protein